MKKVICVVLVAVSLTALLSGCSIFRCQACGDITFGIRRKVMEPYDRILTPDPQEIWVCDDCYLTILGYAYETR